MAILDIVTISLKQKPVRDSFKVLPNQISPFILSENQQIAIFF